MMASGVYNEDGSLNTTSKRADGRNESDLYQKGLENQARHGMNKTIGAGKVDYTTEDGNAAQYVGQAGLEGDIAGGKALKKVYGTDLKGKAGGGVGGSYADTAYNNSTIQNLGAAAEGEANKPFITDALYQRLYGSKKANATVAKAQELGSGEANQKYLDKNGGISGVASLAETSTDAQNIKNTSTTQSLRDEFGDVAGGTGTGNYSDTTYQQAKKSHQSSKGEASAIKKYNKKDPKTGKTTIEEMAEDSTKTQLETYEAGVENAKTAAYEKDGTVLSTEEAREAVVLGNVAKGAEDMAKTAISGAVKKASGTINSDGSISDMKYAKGLISQTTKDTAEGINSTLNYQADMITATTEQLNKATQRVESESKNIPTYNGSDASAALMLSQNKEIQKNKEHNQKLTDALINAQAMQEAAKKGDFATLGKLNASNKIDLANDGMTSSYTAQRGTLQGSSQSGVSYSHNESSNYSYGTSASGGSAFAGMAQAMGMNMGTFAAMSSSIAAAGSIMGAAGMVLPGGRLGSMLSDIGVIGADSTYAMGVGSAVKMRKNEIKGGMSSMSAAQAEYSAAKGARGNAHHNLSYQSLNENFVSSGQRLQNLQSERNVLSATGQEVPQSLDRKIAMTKNRYNGLNNERKYREANYNLARVKAGLGSHASDAWKSAGYDMDYRAEEGIRTGYANEAKYQEGIQTGEGRKTAIKEQLQSSGFKGQE